MLITSPTIVMRLGATHMGTRLTTQFHLKKKIPRNHDLDWMDSCQSNLRHRNVFGFMHVKASRNTIHVVKNCDAIRAARRHVKQGRSVTVMKEMGQLKPERKARHWDIFAFVMPVKTERSRCTNVNSSKIKFETFCSRINVPSVL